MRRDFWSSRLIFIILAIMAIPNHTAAQLSFRDESVLHPLAKDRRDQLIERLTLLVKYQNEEKWEEIYALLSSRRIQGRSKEQWVGEIRKWKPARPFSFTVVTVGVGDGVPAGQESNFLMITGCGDFQSERSVGYTEAIWEKGKWHFDLIGIPYVTPEEYARICGGKSFRRSPKIREEQE